MHFDRFDFLVDIQDVYILPTIRISTQYELLGIRGGSSR